MFVHRLLPIHICVVTDDFGGLGGNQHVALALLLVFERRSRSWAVVKVKCRSSVRFRMIESASPVISGESYSANGRGGRDLYTGDPFSLLPPLKRACGTRIRSVRSRREASVAGPHLAAFRADDLGSNPRPSIDFPASEATGFSERIASNSCTSRVSRAYIHSTVVQQSRHTLSGSVIAPLAQPLSPGGHWV